MGRRRGAITITGTVKLGKHLDRQVANAPEYARQALHAGALEMEQEWKQRAPVRTGTYRRSIHTQSKRSGRTAEATVGTNLVNPPYPIFLEYGTSMMAARPSARPAFDASLSRVMKVAGAVYGRLMTRGRP